MNKTKGCLIANFATVPLDRYSVLQFRGDIAMHTRKAITEAIRKLGVQTGDL
ncbi:scsC protein, partial [Klebsiella pneumoniae]